MEDDAARLDPGGLSPTPAEPVEGGEEPAPIVLPEAPTPEALERAENLIRQSNLAKIRGDNIGADKLLDEAAAAAPGSSTVQEALGDAFVARKQIRKARDCYQTAFKLDPKNISAERKYGECVLSIQLAIDPNFSRPPGDDSFASGKGAVILSLLFPGLGQLVLGQTQKGVVLMGIWIVSWVIALLIPNGLAGLPSLFGGRGPHFNGTVLLPLFGIVLSWLVSISDATSQAKRLEPKNIVRPVPPVDKDF